MHKFSQEEKNKIFIGLTIALAGIAALLGYAIYSQSLPQISQEQERINLPASPQFQPNSQQVIPPPLVRDDLTSEESAVLNTPDINASVEERQRHFELARSIAQDADYLDIGGCSASPVVLRTKKGLQVMARNQNTSDHTIVFNQDLIYPIPAGETKKLEDVFKQGAGLYGYGCDAYPGTAGLILVTD